jgi:hypothetical protein
MFHTTNRCAELTDIEQEVQAADLRVRTGKLPNDGPRIIGRRVVDEKNLERMPRTAEDRSDPVDELRHRFAALIAGDNYRNRGEIFHRGVLRDVRKA